MHLGNIAKADDAVVYMPVNAVAGGRVNPSGTLEAADFKVLDAAGDALATPGISVINNPESLVGYVIVTVSQADPAYIEDGFYALVFDPDSETIDSVTPAAAWQWRCRTEVASFLKGAALTNLPVEMVKLDGTFATGLEAGGANPATIERYDSDTSDFVSVNAGTVLVASGADGSYFLNANAADNPSTNTVNGVWFRITGTDVRPQSLFVSVR